MTESREFEVKKELEEKRKDIKSFDELIVFLEDVKDNYNIGYGEAPRAMAQAALATTWYFAKEFGITGFQASFVMWDFIRDWMYSGNECGMKIVDYDNMLYPQYDHKFDKVISKDVFMNLQKIAKERLEEHDPVHPAVKAHWESIVAGNVPFGYRLEED